MRRLLQTMDRIVAFLCKWGVIGCLLGLFFLLLIAVVVRLVPVIAIAGYDEIVEWLFAWLVFLGTLALWREGALYRVVLIELSVPPPLRWTISVMNQLLMLGFALVVTIKGYEFLRDAGETTPFLGIDKGFWYVVMPAVGSLMTVYSTVGVWRALRGERVMDNGTILG